MKRALLAFSLICIGSVAWAKETVSITYFDIPPHVIYDAGTKKVSGAVVDLLEYLAPEMGVEVVWDPSPTNVPREVKQLEAGEKDMAAVFIMSPGDLARFEFSKEPYFIGRDSLLVKKTVALGQVGKIEDILGWKVGYAPEAYVSDFMLDQRITWDNASAPNFCELNVKKLLAGRIDAAYAPDHAGLLYAMNAAKARNELKVLYTPQPPVPLRIGFSLKKPDLKKRFDAAFAKKDGAKKYQELISKYTGSP